MSAEVQEPLVEIRGLTVARGARKLLDGVELSVGQGEFVALVGPNGAGKSSFLKSLVGVYGGRGRLLFNGVDLHGLSPRERARRIAYLPQQIDVPAGLTAYDYIALGRHPWRRALARWSSDDEARVYEAAGRADVGSFLGRALETLSGGERQRVYLAAALAQQASLLLLDEPTAALDPVQRADLWALLARVRVETGAAVIAATHDIDIASRVVDRVVALRGGRIFFSGDPTCFLSPATVTALYSRSVDVPGVSR